MKTLTSHLERRTEMNIIVKLLSQHDSLMFPNVDEYYEKRKTIKIVQSELYKTTTTEINKEAIEMWTIEAE